MMGALLPSAAVVVEAFTDIPGEPPFPGEEHAVARVVEHRRREFITTRRCAREALARLGHPPAPIPTGSGREPLWPAGLVGSLTHCAGYRAAAVARAANVGGIGIDAEPHGPLPDGVLHLVTTSEERDMLGALAREFPRTHWDRVLFSAKESVYKAWYPLTQRWLDFGDAQLSIDAARLTLSARLLVDGPLTQLHGRYLAAEDLILTAVSVAAPGV
jgi:enterobactin synthetase component D / holo-[acyl-carrier protein] synthase